MSSNIPMGLREAELLVQGHIAVEGRAENTVVFRLQVCLYFFRSSV